MEISGRLLADIYNLMLIIAIFAIVNKGNSTKERVKWYKYVLEILFVIVISKIMSEMPVRGKISNILSLVGNFLLFSFVTLVGCFIIKYIDSCLEYSKKKHNPLINFYLAFSVINLILLLISHMFSLGLFYHFDGINYTKGILYDIRIIFVAIEYVSMQIYIIYNTRKAKNDFSPVLWIFPVYTVFIVILQFFMDNMTHEYTDILFYAIILYIYIQGRELNTDFLTGAVNRRKFDAELTKRVCNCEEAKFSGIMADVDHFKSINDNYGHQAGDDALEAFSSLVIKNFRKTDVVARYGGDEFCILTDICDEKEIEIAIGRIRKSLEEFNKSGKLPFKLSISMGYAIYDNELDGSSAAFLKRLDEKMYDEKRRHHKDVELEQKNERV